MYLKRFGTGIVLGIVIVLTFESFFFALLISISLGNKNVSTMTMPKTMPVQNLLRYISFEFSYQKNDIFDMWPSKSTTQSLIFCEMQMSK